MPNVRIVTDSAAHFSDPAFPEQHAVTVLPLSIQIGRDSYRDGLDISTEQLFAQAGAGRELPLAVAPAVEAFASAFERLSKTTDRIVCIHTSSKFSRVLSNAHQAAEQFLGRTKIHLIDSMSTSIGLGTLVEAAARAAEGGGSADEVVRVVRGLIPRLYAAFFTEQLDYLAQAGRLSPAQATLGAMLNIKPFLALEDGDLVPIEKVRTRAQAVEKLVEFVSEFSELERVGILQTNPRIGDDTRLLLEQLAVVFPGRHWPILTCGPSLATLLGPDAMGVMILEGENGTE